MAFGRPHFRTPHPDEIPRIPNINEQPVFRPAPQEADDGPRLPEVEHPHHAHATEAEKNGADLPPPASAGEAEDQAALAGQARAAAAAAHDTQPQAESEATKPRPQPQPAAEQAHGQPHVATIPRTLETDEWQTVAARTSGPAEAPEPKEQPQAAEDNSTPSLVQRARDAVAGVAKEVYDRVKDIKADPPEQARDTRPMPTAQELTEAIDEAYREVDLRAAMQEAEEAKRQAQVKLKEQAALEAQEAKAAAEAEKVAEAARLKEAEEAAQAAAAEKQTAQAAEAAQQAAESAAAASTPSVSPPRQAAPAAANADQAGRTVFIPKGGPDRVVQPDGRSAIPLSNVEQGELVIKIGAQEGRERWVASDNHTPPTDQSANQQPATDYTKLNHGMSEEQLIKALLKAHDYAVRVQSENTQRAQDYNATATYPLRHNPTSPGAYAGDAYSNVARPQDVPTPAEQEVHSRHIANANAPQAVPPWLEATEPAMAGPTRTQPGAPSAPNTRPGAGTGAGGSGPRPAGRVPLHHQNRQYQRTQPGFRPAGTDPTIGPSRPHSPSVAYRAQRQAASAPGRNYVRPDSTSSNTGPSRPMGATRPRVSARSTESGVRTALHLARRTASEITRPVRTMASVYKGGTVEKAGRFRFNVTIKRNGKPVVKIQVKAPTKLLAKVAANFKEAGSDEPTNQQT